MERSARPRGCLQTAIEKSECLVHVCLVLAGTVIPLLQQLCLCPQQAVLSSDTVLTHFLGQMPAVWSDDDEAELSECQGICPPG